MKRRVLYYILFVAVCALWATLCFVAPDFFDNPTEGWRGVLTILLYIAAIGIFHFLLLYLSALNRYVFAIFLPLYALLGAAVAFYRVAFHATITPMILECVFHTNAGEVASVVSWQLIVYIVLNLLLAAGFVWWRMKKMEQPVKSLWQCVLVLILLFVYYNGNGRLHSSISRRYPMNVVCSLKEYIDFQQERNGGQRQKTEVKVIDETDSLDVVIVIGESTRADHLSLNGYQRNTNPLLSARKNVVSLPFVYSQHTYTSTSVPHLLTCADSITPESAYSQHSFIVNFVDAGFSTAWISNQDYGSTYSAFINEADTTVFPNASKSVFVFDRWTDMELLPHVDNLLQQGCLHNMYVLHTIGSHWYYNNHVAEGLPVFQPTTTNRVVTSNTTEQVVNSYDNTILSMDLFIDSLIRRFEDRNAIVFYQSDHGESLGENGVYLHAAGAEETKSPAALVWYSDKYAAMFPEKVKALKENSQKHYRTDYFFYSVLSAAGMRAEGNDGTLDIFTMRDADE